ncbi:MAG TPA: nuclear transport factor 2 family protein [Frankiaceae bacterium]|nr:nuclear transport factor 2 family protein [Frankiaceae bacterium]
MDTAETLWSVGNLLGEYCVRLDGGRFEEWTALFLAGGRLEMKRQSVVGHDQLLDFARNAPHGVHLCGVPVLTATGDGVTSTCPWNFVDLATGTRVVGYYYDDIVWFEGRHRFRSRRIEMNFPPVRSTSSP